MGCVQVLGLLQVKGKRSAVEVFSVSPRRHTVDAGAWSRLRVQNRQPGGTSPLAHTRRRKRSSIIIGPALRAKSAAKMKPLVGRVAELQLVSV